MRSPHAIWLDDAAIHTVANDKRSIVCVCFLPLMWPVLVLLLAVALLAAADQKPQAWLVSSTYASGGAGLGSCVGPLSSWSAISFGLCQYDASGGVGAWKVAKLAKSDNITTMSYGPTDSLCSAQPLGTSHSQIPDDTMGCHSQFIGGMVDILVKTIAGAYSAVSPFGLPQAPFVGTGYVTTLSSDCSDASQITEISLSDAGTCLDPGAAVADGGDGTSFSISCADPNNPVPLEYAQLDCTGPAIPMTASNPRFAEISETIKAPPCTFRPSSKQYLQQVFCVNTAVATPDRFLFPSPAPTPKPHPTTPPSRPPTAKPTSTPAPTVTYLAADTEALCQLYTTFTGPDRLAKLGSWCQPGQKACDATLGTAPFSSWAGVTCAVVHDCNTVSCGLDNKLRVTAVSLVNMQLGGNVPPAVGGLYALTSLVLSGLGLSGGLPTELGSLKEARVLILKNNLFVGTIPRQLSFLLSLQTLSLGKNSLSGSLPSQLGALSSLTSLDLSFNLLSGGLPSQLGLLSAIGVLNVGYNSLVGAVPGSLCSLNVGAAVSLTGNKFSCLPQCLSSFKSLSKDAGLALCAVPSPRPTEAPTVQVTATPSTLSAGVKEGEPLSQNAVNDLNDSKIGVGGIVGITLGFIGLLGVCYLVYRLVKYSEELPLYDEAVDVQNNPLQLPKQPQQQRDFGGRRDSIPMPQSSNEGPTTSLAQRRDTIPGSIPGSITPRRVDPFKRNQDL